MGCRVFMKSYQKNIFKLFIIYCFVYPFHSIHASQSLNPIQETFYRKAHRLCYTATYYGDMSPHFDQLIHQQRFRQPYFDDFRFREGVEAWLSIDRRSLSHAFTDLRFTGGSERKNTFANMNEIDTLINSDRFEDAIRSCAEERGLVFEDLIENMRSTISRADRKANVFGRIIQLFLFEQVGGLAFRSAIAGFRMVKSGFHAANTRVLTPAMSFVSQNSRIPIPQIGSWVSQTRIAKP